jgi:hypothetical protein
MGFLCYLSFSLNVASMHKSVKKTKKLSFLLIVSSFCELIFLGCVTFCLADRLHGSVKKVLQNWNNFYFFESSLGCQIAICFLSRFLWSFFCVNLVGATENYTELMFYCFLLALISCLTAKLIKQSTVNMNFLCYLTFSVNVATCQYTQIGKTKI